MLSPPTYLSIIVGSVGLFSIASAQFPPEPEGLTILHSRFDDDVYISYKEVRIYRHVLFLARTNAVPCSPKFVKRLQE